MTTIYGYLKQVIMLILGYYPRRHPPLVSAPEGAARKGRDFTPLIGWSNNQFNNLHFKSSLETNKLDTCAAE